MPGSSLVISKRAKILNYSGEMEEVCLFSYHFRLKNYFWRNNEKTELVTAPAISNVLRHPCNTSPFVNRQLSPEK